MTPNGKIYQAKIEYFSGRKDVHKDLSYRAAKCLYDMGVRDMGTPIGIKRVSYGIMDVYINRIIS